ncbi:hypothetical protein BZG36_02943 [Bifiguratus adelaidae]|uniref:HCNGP-like protein n=1 Tax=Bifiguratus adelaidae TaxID=1938954 RepID=A0A261Y006_9FUNG|nr:hypothetical protein BZG36_02943 [Bifiguratus adelaidae]
MSNPLASLVGYGDDDEDDKEQVEVQTVGSTATVHKISPTDHHPHLSHGTETTGPKVHVHAKSNSTRAPPRASPLPSSTIQGRLTSKTSTPEVKSASPSLPTDTQDATQSIPVKAPQLDEEERRLKLTQAPPIEGVSDWGIPPIPNTDPDPDLVAKINHFHELRRQGTIFNEHLLKSKAFRNPHIFQKLIEFVSLDEYGTNLPKSVHDPHGFGADEYATALVEAQTRRGEERALAQAQGRNQIAFTQARAPAMNGQAQAEAIARAQAIAQRIMANAPAAAAESSAEERPKKRTGKWDVPGDAEGDAKKRR